MEYYNKFKAFCESVTFGVVPWWTVPFGILFILAVIF